MLCLVEIEKVIKHHLFEILVDIDNFDLDEVMLQIGIVVEENDIDDLLFDFDELELIEKIDGVIVLLLIILKNLEKIDIS